MGTVKVNFADVEDFDAVPEGVYHAEITKVEYREPREKGKAPYLNVEYTIDDPEEFIGRKVWEVLSWAPKALFRMRDFFRAAGFEDDEYDLEVDEDTKLLTSPDLTEEGVTVTIENEIYDKKERNRVASVEFDNPPGLDETVEVEGDEEEDEEEDIEDEEEEDDEDTEEVEEEVEEEEEEEEEVKPARKAPVKASPAKATPVKATPAKAAPAKVSPVKKATPAPARTTKTTPAKKRTFR